MIIDTNDIPVSIMNQGLMAKVVVDDGCKEDGLTSQQTALVRLGASLMLWYIRENGLPSAARWEEVNNA